MCERPRPGASIAPQRHRKITEITSKPEMRFASIAPQRHRKSVISAHFRSATRSLNRSSEASKAKSATFLPADVEAPQSLLRGIERNVSEVGIELLEHGLNRSSEASKGSLAALLEQLRWVPQSLLRGIESRSRRCRLVRGASPQSLLRGIESRCLWRVAPEASWPQSLLRGIERGSAPRQGGPCTRASIAPQRHRKPTTARRAATAPRSLNRSSEASKGDLCLVVVGWRTSLNRSSEASKDAVTTGGDYAADGLNRSSEASKERCIRPPQEHEHGLNRSSEASKGDGTSPVVSTVTGLNRSSEASKVGSAAPSPLAAGGLNRSSEASKGRTPRRAAISARGPQSLLRGIERPDAEARGDLGARASIAPQRHRKHVFTNRAPPRDPASIAPQRHRKLRGAS